ncbi:hypothetical protein Ancab_039909 [Ancistrocladus abbreviatus]
MRAVVSCCPLLSVWPFVCFMFITTCIAVDTINANQSIKDGETLVSTGGRFVLGFFSPVSSSKRYVGIWYRDIPSWNIVWVANRETPLLNRSGILKVTENPPSLVLVNSTGSMIWSSNSSRSTPNPIAQLLESGNLVVKDRDDNHSYGFLWQSFDYPCDVQLPGMKLGWNLVSGLDRYLTSWKSGDDPSQGSYKYEIDPRGYPQLVLMKGSVEQFRNGPWNGFRFIGNPNLKPNPLFTDNFVLNETELYYVYELADSSVIAHTVLNHYGNIQRLIWNGLKQGWTVYWTGVSDSCDTYATCGMFGNCNINNSPECGCLEGFIPKSPQNWQAGNWSEGCVRRTLLGCNRKDGFIKYSNMKLPDTRYAWYNTKMTLDECRKQCLQNCSCVAHSNIYVTDEGSGCLLWIDVLIDLEVYTTNGQDLYVRVAASELGNGKKRIIVIAICTSLAAVLLLLSAILFVWNKRRIQREGISQANEEEPELPLFGFDIVADATNNFSPDNKLGEGGFGPVYKGVLKGGREIAVKRLSKHSKQGLNEFKNEVKCISSLQHRNLVKLLGCCIHAEERMLIYEYMLNQSLDYFIFDEMNSILLDWPKRWQIINGIARGLLYLHEDSRLRIIHRDLKASNVLLDFEMSPKISDFGIARSFHGNKSEAKTRRVVGTYGYMSPEYAMEGQFSVKSDVFSFGVLVLEIVTGKRNRGFNHPDHSHNLLGHVWKLFLDGESLEVANPVIGSSYNTYQALRSIHIALLCVQQCPEDRPSMSSVIVMLDSDSELPVPKMPGFFAGRPVVEVYSPESLCSKVITTTLVSGR